MVELVLRVQQAWVEPVSDALADELGALAVSLEDADAHTPAEQAIFGEPGLPAPQAAWPQSTLRALFDSEQAATDALTLLLAQDDSDQALQVQALVPVPDADWVRLTQSQFAPVAVTPTFWIVPSWHDAPAPARTVLRLDPGLAFGTGTHPTTRMCLRWIADNAQPWPRVLDYGCGSGILAIAAALHGANGVDAVDIDAAAVASTRANAAHNGVRVSAGLPSAAYGRYALVLANILAKPLVLLAPLLCRHVAPGGQFVLAGILERQADELTAAYAPACALRVTERDDGWVLMTATFDGGPR
jgi:ribosomal protein L11 methyltransferase